MNSYDNKSYQSKVHRGRHIESLYTASKIRGLKPKVPFNAKVLDIGCSIGGSIFPMALEYPQSDFIGIDPSDNQIKQAISYKEYLGVNNVTFWCGNISTNLDKLKSLGKFDYILCHGVASWISNIELDEILGGVKDLLADDGVFLMSYNITAGGSIRQSMWRNFGELFIDSKKTLNKEILSSIRNAIELDYERPYQMLLYQELSRLISEPDHYLEHEVLNSATTSFSYREISNTLQKFDLIPISDSRPHLNGITRLTLASVPDSSFGSISSLQAEGALLEDILDLIFGTSFRETIIIKDKSFIDFESSINLLESFIELSFDASFLEVLEKDENNKIKAVRSATGKIVNIKSSLVSSVINIIKNAAPNFITFHSLVLQLKDSYDDKDLICKALLECYNRELLTISFYPPKVSEIILAHPKVSPWTRLLASKSQNEPTVFPNLHYRSVELDSLSTAIISKCDGVSDMEDFARLAQNLFESGKGMVKVDGQVIENNEEVKAYIPELVENALNSLKQGAFLIS